MYKKEIQDSVTYRINKLELGEQTIAIRRSSHSSPIPKTNTSQLHMIAKRQIDYISKF